MQLSLRRTSRLLVAFTIAVSALAIPMAPAFANHDSTTIRVGVDNTGDVGRNNYDDSDITVMTGTPIDFFFEDGFHNVLWAQDPSSSLSDSPGAPGGDTVGTTWSLTMPSTPGEYIYFCSIHTNAGTALGAGSYSDDGEMIGRITVVADTTAPVWDAGSASATAVSASQVDLSYPAATDDSGTAFYDIYQGTGATDPGKGSATLISDNWAGASYSATGLTAGVHYWYWITPVDGAGNEGSDLTADATTSSVAASATASHVVQFSINPTLSLTVTPSLVDMGTLSPASVGTGSATVTVQSNDTWSMSVKSVGRDAVDDTIGDDGFFTADGGQQVPVGRATWDAGAGPAPLTAAGDDVVTAQAPTSGLAMNVDYAVTLLFEDVAATNYQTTVLYTVTQP